MPYVHWEREWKTTFVFKVKEMFLSCLISLSSVLYNFEKFSWLLKVCQHPEMKSNVACFFQSPKDPLYTQLF